MLNPDALTQVDDIEQLADRKACYSQNRQHETIRLIVKALLLSLPAAQRDTILDILADGDMK